MHSCTVHDRDQPNLDKACVSRDCDDDTIYLDVTGAASSAAVYLSLRAARRLFCAGLQMCDEIEAERKAK